MTLIDRVPARDCGFGCGARIYRNKELKIWQEEWSDIIHDKRRCWAIKEQQRRDATADKKAPRMEIVEEMIDVLLQHQFGIPIEDRAYHIIKSRKDKDSAVTLDEIAIALNPDKVYIDKKGNKKPTPEGRTCAAGAIYRARMKLINDNLAVFGTKFSNGQYHYWNMQNKDEFNPVKIKKEKNIETMRNVVKRFGEMVELPPEEREKRERMYDSLLNEKSRRRRKKDNQE